MNYGGGMYWFFEHAAWDGLTFADLMMPWFLFMAGVSIRFGILSRMKRNSKWGIVLGRFHFRWWAISVFEIEKFPILITLLGNAVNQFL